MTSNHSVFGIAESWLDRGVSVFPCLPRSKYPAVAWKPYQDALPSREQVRAWFGNEHAYNLAVVCGRGLVVLDFDGMGAFAQWKRAHPQEAQTFTVATARGRHCYFWCDAETPTRLRSGVDVKARGGYVLTAPSVHPSGVVYRVVNAADIWRVRSVDELLGADSVNASGRGDTQYKGYATRRQEGAPRGDLVGAVREALPILSLVSRYTEFRASSLDGRWYLARCPFPGNHAHGDRHWSFWIDARRGVCGCFAPKCKAQQPRGLPMDVVNLYARLHGLDNRAAILALADELNLLTTPVFGASEVSE